MLEIFSNSAKDLAKNPLGIIALFIVLVYGFACLLFGFSADKLMSEERMPIIYFVILFPIAILILFGWLVAKHHNKLYAPSDFKDDTSFLQTINQNLSVTKTIDEKNIQDLLNYGSEFIIVKENEEFIKNELIKRGFNENLSEPLPKVLIRQLGASQALVWFEKTYNQIFGSQLKILQKALEKENLEINNEFIKSIFEETKETNKEALRDWNLSQYLKFLFESRLIEEKNSQIFLTNTGSEFLKMIQNSNYSFYKSL